MKDKLEKLKKLADAMYYAAQQLTTDASRLHEAMDEYHKFIINEYYKEEPINYDKLNTMLDDALAKETKESLNERLGISQKEYGKIVDGCLYGKEPELVDVDDLPKEEPVNNDFEMALAEMIDKAQTSVVEPLMIAAQWKDELIKLAKSEEPISEQNLSNVQRTVKNWKEEPVSEDLEQAIDTYLATYFGGDKEKRDWPFLKKMAIHFANWQKLYDMGLTEKAEMKTVSELFNSETDELKKYATEIAFMMLPATCTQSYHDTNRVRIIDAVIYGANWQKEQMMAKAVDAVVKIDAGGYPYVDRTIELYDYDKDIPLAKKGDKVKILVIREE